VENSSLAEGSSENSSLRQPVESKDDIPASANKRRLNLLIASKIT
jgi:hypothetical protein